MKKFLKQEKGVTLLSLAAVIIVIGIITTMLLYSVGDTKDVTNLTSLYSDIDNLSDKINNYYSIYGKIPAFTVNGVSNVTDNWKALGEENEINPLGKNDTGRFLVIDLNALDNLTLNYGKAFENIKTSRTISSDEDKDIYIINENSHNVFYLAGIEVNSKMYYTNKDKDTQIVDLRYVDGIKIPDGYNYKSGNKNDKENELTIENGTEEYKWANIENETYKLSEDGKNVINSEGVSKEIKLSTSQDLNKFIESADEYGGFYYLENEGLINVLYINVEDKWSQVYDMESTYTDKNGESLYIPKGFRLNELKTKSTVDRGVVIKNDQDQEFVWINLPDYVLKDEHSLDEIEIALKKYVNNYRDNEYTDTWYNGCGISSSKKYNDMKNSMYLSIKERGGFWVSRDIVRKNITCTNAQNEANNINVEGKNSSLLFGIQWDLVCKFISNNPKNNLLNFGSDVPEWTLEKSPNSNSESQTDNNSVSRGGSGQTIYKRNKCNYTASGIGYRATFYDKDLNEKE